LTVEFRTDRIRTGRPTTGGAEFFEVRDGEAAAEVESVAGA
jgi:hypothetical protein